MDSAKFVLLQLRSHLGWIGFGHAKKVVLALHPNHDAMAEISSLETPWSELMTRCWESAGRPQVHTLLAPSPESDLAPDITTDFSFESKRLLRLQTGSVREFGVATEWLKQWQQMQRDLLFLECPELRRIFQDQESAVPFLPEEVYQRLAQWLESRGNTQELFDLEHPLFRSAWTERHRRKKILVHVCCGPDAVGVFEQLRSDYDIVGFWYDPNIQPKSEYDLRLAAFVQAAQALGIPHIVGDYDVDVFMERIRGLEWSPEQGAKCTQCYDLRLERAAVEAERQGCDLFTTTLAISPHKVQEKLTKLGERHGQKVHVPYLARNFMKEDGFKSATTASQELGLYRQDYCGCYFSLHEGGKQAQSLAQELGYLPPSSDSHATESTRKESVT